MATDTARVETLTVLFTDLVDSTGIRVRLGEEAAERVRERHDLLVHRAVVGHGGRVAKHTGDGVMATFSGASDALAAAVAVQQDIDGENRRAASDGGPSELLQVRVGVSAGDVTVEGDDCFGLPVVEAQRLESASRPGQILISALVSALAHGRGGHELRPVGLLELKGLERPLEAEEVAWRPRPDNTTAPVLPPSLADRAAFPFAGRTKETELLAGAWLAVSSGATRLVLVAGEPGIGKTRLAAEAAEQVLANGATVLAGRCDELVGAPYQPFAQALRHRVGSPGGAEVLGPAPGELVRLAPELADVVPGLPEPLSASPDAERLRLFEAVRDWLAALAVQKPVMLVLDDLHWAESGTLLLLRHLIVTDPVPALLVVATYRDTDLDRTHPLAGMLGELRRRGEVTRVALEGLDAGEVTDLMTLAAGHDLEEDGTALALAVQSETGGNPFFIGEVLRHLAESGAIVYSKGRWSAARSGGDPLLPEGIREVVGRRISALPDPTQAALATAAVIGVDFELEVLAAVADAAEDDLINALDPALDANLVAETGVGHYRFSHALVRSTLHEELSTTRRARLHRSVAQSVEALRASDLDAVATDLAYHWGEAGPATANDHAIAYARRAGELAEARLAPEEAARWYRQAREQLDGHDKELDAQLAVRIGLAEALAGADGWQGTLVGAARAAEAVGNVALMAEALCVSRRSVLTVDSPEGADLEKIALLERALELAVEDPAVTARLNGALALELLFTGDDKRRTTLVAATEAYRDSLDDPVERHRVWQLAGRGTPISGLYQRADQAFVEWTEVNRLAEERCDFDIAAAALAGVVHLSLYLGRPDRHQPLERLADLLARYPHPFHADEAILSRMVEALVDGRISDAEALVEAVDRQWRTHGRGREVVIYVTSGRLEIARERAGLGPLTDFMQAIPLQAVEDHRPMALGGLIALSKAEAGRVDDAVADIDRKSANGFRDIPEDYGLPVAVSAWAEAAALVGHQQACAALYDRLVVMPHIHQATGGWYLGSTTRYLALLTDALGRPQEADTWFARAVEAHKRMRTPPWLARGRLDWADSLLRREEVQRARSLAEQALLDLGNLELDASRARAERIRADT
jgi:class 3 adenylate cyclase